MKQELDARRIVREWLEPSGRGSPLHLDLLNTALIVCLGACVIARQEADGGADTSAPMSYGFWVEAAGRNPPVSVRDLIYDLLFPAIPKQLRDAVLALEQSTVSPEEAARLIWVLFSRQPDLPAVRATGRAAAMPAGYATRPAAAMTAVAGTGSSRRNAIWSNSMKTKPHPNSFPASAERPRRARSSGATSRRRTAPPYPAAAAVIPADTIAGRDEQGVADPKERLFPDFAPFPGANFRERNGCPSLWHDSPF